MSNSTLGIVVFGVLLVGLVLSPAIVPARAAPSSYVPNVSAGQWAKYKVLYDTCTGDPTACQMSTPGSLADSDYGLLQVTDVFGTGVTLSLLSVYLNGTSSHEGLLVDVASGAINNTGLGGGSSGNYFVLATGLAPPDPIWTSPNAPKLNTTRPEVVLSGNPRSVNFLNYSFSTNIPNVGSYSLSAGFAFDQSSGLFIEISFSSTSTGSFGNSNIAWALGMVDNNVWQTSYLPDYSLNANPTTVNIAGTATGTATITPIRVYGFSAKVSLTATPSTSGLTCSLSPSSVAIGSDTSTLSCSGSPGSYTVTVKGNGSYLVRTASVTVNIASTTSPDFQISHSGSISFQTGGSGQATITIAAQNGYSATTTLEITNVPSGLTCSLDKTNVSGYGSATLTCSGQPGSYTVTVKATGGGTSHSTDTAVTVSSASVSTQPPSGLPMLFVYVGIGAVAVAVAGLLAFLFLRKKPGENAVAPGDGSTPASQA